MSSTITVEKFVGNLNEFFDETFEKVYGIYLDRATSLFETLETITAEDASKRVGGKCASIAGQVEHVRFYLHTLSRYMRQEEVEKIDWAKSWWLTEVNNDEWEALKAKLKEQYKSVRDLVNGIEDWEVGDLVSEAMATVVHTAYHLGEIRQAMCTVIGS